MEQLQNDEERRLTGLVTCVVDTVAEVILTRMAARLGSSPVAPDIAIDPPHIPTGDA